MREVVLVSAARTPIGRFLGGLASVPAPRLGSIAIAEAVRRGGIAKTDISEVIMGHVLTAGVGQAPARQATLFATLPSSVPATTVNKMCGSGLKSVMLGAQAIAIGDADIVVAGGMENMSAAPYVLPKARGGYRLGNGVVIDSMLKDGLIDAYSDLHMGNCAELLAREYRIGRAEQDEYARLSYTRAIAAMDDGAFAEEIVTVEVPQPKGEPTLVTEDEEPRRANLDRLGTLRPAFEENGTVTAGNASSISDGAAAVTLMAAEVARERKLRPLARVVGQAGAAMAPEWFTIAPAQAAKTLLEKVGWTPRDVDLFEINEAFAAVVVAVSRDLGISTDRVNVHGGAVALGHPIGASGARILTTLLYAMARREAHRGVVAICLAGGEAVALAIERPA